MVKENGWSVACTTLHQSAGADTYNTVVYLLSSSLIEGRRRSSVEWDGDSLVSNGGEGELSESSKAKDGGAHS
jgi:hypothetical protein